MYFIDIIISKCSYFINIIVTDVFCQDLITKKMEELKCPGDDEFAEYIIVMLHNNKSAGDVQAELEPFLGTQAAVFTPW